MLGKGLESLIPPHQSSDEHGMGQAPQQSHGSGDGQPQSDFPNDEVVLTPYDEAAATTPPVPVDPQPVNPAPAFAPEELRRGEPASTSEEFRQSEPAEGDFRSKIRINLPEEKRGRIAPSRPEEDYVFHIEVSKIKANPAQPRRDFNEAGIRELALSIREFGFLQPLVVSKIEKETATGIDVEYQLIAGERRLLAAKMLGLEMVPAIIRRVDLEREKLELAVVENIQREDLNPIEKARALARLQDEFRMTQREIAAKLGKSREVVANSVRLLGLPTYAQEALIKGQITESHGRFLLAIDDQAAQKKLFDDMLARHLTMRELRERVQMSRSRGQEVRSKENSANLTPEMKMMEEKLSAELGTPVKIEKGANTGKITITFYSEEELESIVRKIGKEEG